MKGALLLSLFYFFSFSAFSQTGSAGSPFTSLGNARNVTAAGIYYFNLGGTTFSSYVNTNGMVLVATDFGGAAAANLPQVTALTNSGRGILSAAVLATLTSATTVMYTTSNGAVNASHTSSTILSRITANATIHKGINDIAVNSGWTGTGSTVVAGAGSSCVTAAGTTLNTNIHHPCGDGTSFHWIPGTGLHRTAFNSGESAGTVQFNLWVGAPLVPLPVTLRAFEAVLSSDKSVALTWTTETEVNSDYFIVERSFDGINWSAIAKINAHNNTGLHTSYSATDSKPIAGNIFYRLRIVDIGGYLEYSKTVSLNLQTNSNAAVTIYPNPGRNLVYINLNSPGTLKIFNGNGAEITGKVKITMINDGQYSVDFSKEPKGMYIIKGEHFSRKIAIE